MMHYTQKQKFAVKDSIVEMLCLVFFISILVLFSSKNVNILQNRYKYEYVF